MANKTPKQWKSRIIGYADVDPNELLANPANWRVHPKAQQDALSGVLSEVGWVQAVVVNQTTGHVVDGHLRVSLALSRNEATIPAVLVELTEDEEKLILATIDPIAAMAVADKEQLDELLRGVNSDSAAVQSLLSSISDDGSIGWEDAAARLATEDRAPFQQMTFTLHDTQAEIVRCAIAKARPEKTSGDNDNSNGNALAAICEAYLGD